MNCKYLNFQEKTEELIGFLSTQRRFVVAAVCLTFSGYIGFEQGTEEIIFKLLI
jgi:hypothetical protein